MNEAEAQRRMETYCSVAERCRADVELKMMRWGMERAAVQRILTHLEKEHYIDEQRFCHAFVRDKFRFDKWGKVKISQALQLKKIPSSTSWLAIREEIDEDEYLQTLRNLLATKRKSIRTESESELKDKLARFALSRGFEWDDVLRCLNESADD